MVTASHVPGAWCPGPAPLSYTVIRNQDQEMFSRSQSVPGFLTVNTSSVPVLVITRNLITIIS